MVSMIVRQVEGQMNGWEDRQMDGQTDGLADKTNRLID